MHFHSKKREAERIDVENQKLMERIIMSAGTINVKQMSQQFSQQQRRRKLQKQNSSSVISMIKHREKLMASVQSNYLPAITEKQTLQPSPAKSVSP